MRIKATYFNVFHQTKGTLEQVGAIMVGEGKEAFDNRFKQATKETGVQFPILEMLDDSGHPVIRNEETGRPLSTEALEAHKAVMEQRQRSIEASRSLKQAFKSAGRATSAAALAITNFNGVASTIKEQATEFNKQMRSKQ